MSRIIIKNLPKKMKEERLRKLFGEKGQITDCSLKYTKDNVFRKFAFIGYKTSEEAQAAISHFNKTFIDTAKIEVEIARDLGDMSLPRPWSKYSKGSSAFEQETDAGNLKTPVEKKGKSSKSEALLGELQDNPKFSEFLEAHKPRSTKAVWGNDLASQSPPGHPDNQKHDRASDAKTTVSGSDTSGDDSGSSDNSGSTDDDQDLKEPGTAGHKSLSDLEYLKSKIVKSHILSDESSDSDDSSHDSGHSEDSESDSAQGDNDSEAALTDESDSETDLQKAEETFKEEQANYRYIMKMKGLPASVKKSQIVKFFNPIVPRSIKIPQYAKAGKSSNTATVQFSKELDLEQAMKRNKNYVGKNKIFLFKSKEKATETVESTRPWEVKVAESEQVEGIEESGRLYIRNLPYCAEESDLEKLFGTFGPLSEIHMPLDSFTKKTKGFAFITFMMPEHAVKAFSDLDGTTFQGRILHILPGKPPKDQGLEFTDGMSYKQQKELKQRQQSSSSHNWNTLFLGANAVADVMAEKYSTSKDHILDAEDRKSLGVRMALGETQLVAETRDFLMQHSIVLDAFHQGQDKQSRSKSVILVKNLPANTRPQELKELFARHGTLGRVVLPPSGITAVVEFVHPTEARAAFRSLAYTKFKHLPLYLEWAPGGIFNSSLEEGTKPGDKEAAEGTKPGDKEAAEGLQPTEPSVSSQEVDKSEVDAKSTKSPEIGSCLFIKNLNFETREESLSKHFQKYGEIHKVTIAKKKDLKNIGNMLSMGYGFVEYVRKKSADKALRQLQHSTLDDHKLELKISTRSTVQSAPSKTKTNQQKPPATPVSSKILVRNIPFEAKQHEVKELFSVFGELKFVRLPKKMTGTGSHRGFGFVDFVTREDAKRAFDALCHSTHLYGRRLVLEWAEMEENIDKLRQKTAEHFHEEPAKKKFKKSNLMEELNRTENMDA